MKPDPGQSSPEKNQGTSPDRRELLIQSSAAAVVAATVATASSSGHAASTFNVLQQPLINSELRISNGISPKQQGPTKTGSLKSTDCLTYQPERVC